MPDPVLREAGFVRFFLARGMATLAFQMQAVAVGWQVYALTHSTFALGMVGLAQFLPMVVLTLPAGHVADRRSRRAIVRTCQGVAGVASAALALHAQIGGAVAPIFLLVAASAGARAFEAPSASALVPGLVAPGLLTQAMAWSASANQTATIIGPALGGLLYAVSPGVPYAVAAGLYAAACVLTSLVRVAYVPPPREAATWRRMFSGIGFIFSRQAILGCISLDLFAVLLGGATALLPAFARDILHTGPWGLGLLRSAPAVGALAMSLVLARRRITRRAGPVMFASVALFGAATVVFGLSRSVPLSLAALAVLGAADVVSVVIRQTLVQVGTPDAMRGRVSAVNMMFIGTSNQLGEFESGITAALFGTVPAVVVGGLGTVVVALAWAGLFPSLRRLDTLEQAA